MLQSYGHSCDVHFPLDTIDKVFITRIPILIKCVAELWAFLWCSLSSGLFGYHNQCVVLFTVRPKAASWTKSVFKPLHGTFLLWSILSRLLTILKPVVVYLHLFSIQQVRKYWVQVQSLEIQISFCSNDIDFILWQEDIWYVWWETPHWVV